MKCECCGRFMKLEIDIENNMETPYSFCCTNADCLNYGIYIPSPAYNWRYWGISEAELEEIKQEDEETYNAFIKMRKDYEKLRSTHPRKR